MTISPNFGAISALHRLGHFKDSTPEGARTGPAEVGLTDFGAFKDVLFPHFVQNAVPYLGVQYHNCRNTSLYTNIFNLNAFMFLLNFPQNLPKFTKFKKYKLAQVERRK